MKTHSININAILTLLLISITGSSFAQTAQQKLNFKSINDATGKAGLSNVDVPGININMPDEQRNLAFKKGDEYQRTTVINSSTVLQRSNQKFDIKSNSLVTKNYNVTEATNTGYTVAVTTKRIADTLFAMGKSMQYNSDSPSDTGSFIQKRLGGMIGKTAYVNIGRRDTIFSIKDARNPVSNDTLFAFTGIQDDQLVKGGSIGLTVNYLAIQNMKKDYTWMDTSSNAGQKFKNTFWIQAKDAKTTTIAFESEQRQAYSNSNTNGVYVVDNATGVVLTRQLQSITTGYQVLNNVVYAASRRTALTESVYKTR